MRTIGENVIGLDFAALMTIGQARSADLELLAEILPAVDRHVAIAWRRES